MSGPHIEDELFGMSDEEVKRYVASLRPESLDPPRRPLDIHHVLPNPAPPDDPDEGVGADIGED